MLNSKNERELAYLVRVDNVMPMNADRLECVRIGGWHCVCGKHEFYPGDLGIYFEIDSKLPEVEPFSSIEFLKSKEFKIKTQKIRGEYSQGLLLPVSAFGWSIIRQPNELPDTVMEQDQRTLHCLNDDSRFLTEQLNVTYNVAFDNFRKSQSANKYKSMASRNQKIAKSWWWRKLYKSNTGKKILFFFFGKKSDKKSSWPEWVVKTDEERCQNMPWLFPGNNEEWIATEKIDGTSTTFTIKGFGRGQKFYTCSRNVVMDKPDKPCYYDSNFYLEMEHDYDMRTTLEKMLRDFHEEDKDVTFVTVQAETYGEGVQKRDYHKTGRAIAVFNIIKGYKDGHTVRLNPIQGNEVAKKYSLPYVPIIDEHFKLPETCEDLLQIAEGQSVIDGDPREGLVFRSQDGNKSFKAVSSSYLIKYHG